MTKIDGKIFDASLFFSAIIEKNVIISYRDVKLTNGPYVEDFSGLANSTSIKRP